MANTLHVFTDHDRHQVLMNLARKVAEQVEKNPDHSVGSEANQDEPVRSAGHIYSK